MAVNSGSLERGIVANRWRRVVLGTAFETSIGCVEQAARFLVQWLGPTPFRGGTFGRAGCDDKRDHEGEKASSNSHD